jgi:hypothetical protein
VIVAGPGDHAPGLVTADQQHIHDTSTFCPLPGPVGFHPAALVI